MSCKSCVLCAQFYVIALIPCPRPQPWIPTAERYHHALLVELVPATPPQKPGLRLQMPSASGAGAGSGSAPGSPSRARKPSSAPVAAGGSGSGSGAGAADPDSGMYQWRLSLWKSPEQRLTCDVYTSIDVEHVSAFPTAAAAAGTGTGTGTSTATSSPQPPPHASRRGYRQTKQNNSNAHSAAHGHASHHNNHKVYVVDLDWVASVLLPTSAQGDEMSAGSIGKTNKPCVLCDV